MTTLSQARRRNYEAGNSNGVPVAAATRIFEGAAVGLVTATGYARPLTSADTFIGFASATVDNRSGAAGALNVDLVAAGSVELPVTGAVITNLKASVYASDDDTFNLTSGVYIGEVKRYVSAGVVVVAFDAIADLSNVARTVRNAAGNIAGLAREDGTTIPLASMPFSLAPAVVGKNYCGNAAGTAGTNFSYMSRYAYVADRDLNYLQMVIDVGQSGTAGTGGETQQLQGIIYRAAAEYPSGQTPKYFSAGGKETYALFPNTQFISDPLGVRIKSGDTFYPRFYERVPSAPTGATATPIAGGSLAAQAWYYTVTTVDNGVESSAAAEFTGTTATTNLAMRLDWTNATAGVDSVRIYRSSGSGGTKQLIGEAGGKATSFIDYGLTANSAINPPTSITPWRNARLLNTGDSITNSNTAADATGSTGALATTGPNAVFSASPSLIVGNRKPGQSYWGCTGDSISAGSGLNPASLVGGPMQAAEANYFAAACIARGVSFFNHSIGGAQQAFFFDGTIPTRNRVFKERFVSHFLGALGTNDLAASVTWQNLALSTLYRAEAVRDAGTLYFTATVLPRGSTTDLGVLITNFTQAASNAERVNFNNWIRNGCQTTTGTSAGTPVLTGGTRCTAIAGYAELADVLEVNASNVSTRDGGYLKCPTAATYTGQVLTGSPSATSLPVGAGTYTVPSATANGLKNYVVKMTSGARSGEVALVSTNTATNITVIANGASGPTGSTVIGFSGAPTAGDTFDLWDVTAFDGVHPLLSSHVLLQAVMEALIVANQ